MMNPMYGRMMSLGSKQVQPQRQPNPLQKEQPNPLQKEQPNPFQKEQPNPLQKEQPIEEQRTIPTTRGGLVTMPQRKMALQRRLNRTSQPLPQSRGAAGQRGAFPGASPASY
jgi:hypothetical protein